jgi:CheY-like chemotaxis protein
MTYEHLRGKRILIVDDTPSIVHRLRLNFEALGCDVFVAGDVQGALACPPVDVAIVDMYIPDVSGVTDIIMRGEDLCYRLRQKMPNARMIGISEYIDNLPRSPVPNVISKFVPKDRLPPGKTPVALFEIADRLLAADRKPYMFIVHATNDPAALELKNYLQNTLDLGEARMLEELASGGRVIIEKFEEEAHILDLVFVVATPDDALHTTPPARRPRGNVLFELGYFYARLMRLSGRIIVLRKDPVELPSDISGIIYIDITLGVHAASEEIRRELRRLDWLT